MDHPGKTKVVLLACGSFNPITNMHMRMFELARDYLEDTGKFEVAKGIISPVGDGYKKKGLIEAKHRVEMARLATEASDWIKVDSWESQQADWVETAKVLRHHHVELDSEWRAADKVGSVKVGRKRRRKGASMTGRKRRRHIVEVASDGPASESASDRPRLMLLCGADVLESFAVPGLWKSDDIAEIVGSHGLVCITRDGSDADSFVKRSDELQRHSDNIHVVQEWAANKVSATGVRRALCRGHSVRYLVPEPALQYIQQRRLYTPESENRNADAVLAPLNSYRKQSESGCS